MLKRKVRVVVVGDRFDMQPRQQHILWMNHDDGIWTCMCDVDLHQGLKNRYYRRYFSYNIVFLRDRYFFY